MGLDLRPGDIFCTRNPMHLGKLIKWVQTFNSVDNSAMVSHAGIVLKADATTYEAVWTIRRQNLYADYGGDHVLIGRHKDMTTERFLKGWLAVSGLSGGKYPVFRLPLMGLFPRLSKYIYWGRPVCSELTFQFLKEAGLVDYYKSVTPDYIADAIRNWKDFQIVFDGQMPMQTRTPRRGYAS